MTPNERLKQLRQTLGMTQREFADRVALSISYISAMEIAIKKVNDRSARLIGREFKVNEHWIRTGKGKMFTENIDLNTSRAQSLFKTLSPKAQTLALTFLKSLSSLEGEYK